MARITNKKLSEELCYIKGKLEVGDRFAKEHRAWEVTELQKIENHLEQQNGRLRKAENSLSWLKGLTGAFSVAIGWIFKRTL